MAISGISSARAADAGRGQLLEQREAANEQLQNVFTAVLQASGRSGYTSAQPLAAGSDLPQQIGDSWHEWFNQFSTTRYTFQPSGESPSVQPGKSATQVRDDYQAILLDAYAHGGYANPEQYVKSLPPDQLKTIQQVHHLAAAIDPTSLSTEASLNLLLPPGAQVDADHNGLVAIGAGSMLQFPNSDTPTTVRDAWVAAIADVPEQDRLTYQMQMMMPVVLANLKVDDSGQFVRSVQPGEADWTNPMNSAEFSYEKTASDWLDYLDRFKNQMSSQRYSSDKSFWTKFRDQLVGPGGPGETDSH